MVDDLKKGYYLLFIAGGKRANEQGHGRPEPHPDFPLPRVVRLRDQLKTDGHW